MTSGFQVQDNPSNSLFVWPVANGDPFAPVPIPPAVWLFGSALGLMGVMRRKATA